MVPVFVDLVRGRDVGRHEQEENGHDAARTQRTIPFQGLLSEIKSKEHFCFIAIRETAHAHIVANTKLHYQFSQCEVVLR